MQHDFNKIMLSGDKFALRIGLQAQGETEVSLLSSVF